MSEMRNNMDQRHELVSTLLAIYRNEHVRPAKDEARRIADFIESATATDPSLTYDEFGLNRTILALKAIRLAVDEIGIRGHALTAYLLRAVVSKPDQCELVERYFGKDVAQTLRGFLRVEAIEVKTEAMRTDNFRNLLVSQAGDMRIVLMLIADCVNLMRHIKDTENVEAQRKVSTEAAYLYAPLAHKLGLYKLKSELEDLSLKYLEHDAYYMIKENLNATKRSRDAYIERFIAPIRKMLDAEGLRYHMKGRTKSIHSIWQKMKKQQCGFHGVYDLFAIRIILDSPIAKEKEQCWKVFSLITNKYESNLKRLRDWLTVPKSNGYESLHITVKGPEDKWVEVQIRTERMDEIAEHGLAAHWRYKGVKSSGGGVDSWLADIRSALETGNEGLLTQSLSSNAKEREVYVFSPKGDLYRLPPRSTVLDFAYTIHTAGIGSGLGGFAKKFAKFRTVCHVFAGFFQLAALLGYAYTILIKVIRSSLQVCVYTFFYFISISVKSIVLFANLLNYNIFLITAFLRCCISHSIFAKVLFLICTPAVFLHYPVFVIIGFGTFLNNSI